MAFWEGIILIGGFFAIVCWKLLTGAIALDQLFEGDQLDPSSPEGYSSYVSGGRIQSFLIFMFAVLYYLGQVIHNLTEFPKLPNLLVDGLAGSQAVYLGGKARAMVRGQLLDFLK